LYPVGTWHITQPTVNLKKIDRNRGKSPETLYSSNSNQSNSVTQQKERYTFSLKKDLTNSKKWAMC
jgi:hypothetical protein